MILSDIKVGDQIQDEFLISNEKIKSFSELVNDFAPIHFDAKFAKSKGFDGNIAHGLLTSSFISGLLGNKLPGPNSVINEINLKYHNPIYPGQKILITINVQRVISAVKAVYLTINIEEKQTSTLIVSGRSICSFPK